MTIDRRATNATNTEGYASTTNRLRAALPPLELLLGSENDDSAERSTSQTECGGSTIAGGNWWSGCGFALREPLSAAVDLAYRQTLRCRS
ncbi:hypothetical protein XHV734_3170 [Xanthomonas hortorum pv. vitians]|nr:hypothetical protein XHV734_3170 [Xanthomonas hortorum pv. vitians]